MARYTVDRPTLNSSATGVGDGSCEPVELGDDQGVASAAGGHCLAETGPGSVSAGEAVVDVDPVGVDAEGCKAVALGSEVLASRRYPGLPNVEFGHSSSVAG